MIRGSILLAFLLVPPIQDSEARFARKLEKEFLKKSLWITDFDKAREEARKAGRPILTYFTRSDFDCAACNEAEDGPLFKDRFFAPGAQPFMLFCHVTTNIKGRKYDRLFAERGGRTYPWFAIVDAAGNLTARQEGPATLEELKAMVTRSARLAEVRINAEAGDKAARVELALREIELHHFKLEEARKREFADLTADQKLRLERALVRLEISEILVSPIDGNDPVAKREAGRRLAEMKKAGRIPAADEDVQIYWILILEFAQSERAAALFETGLNALRARFGEDPRSRVFFEEKTDALRRLKEEKKP